MLNLKDVSSKLRMQGGTGCWIYGRVDQLLWNLFHGERWRSSIPIVKWPIRSLWMIQDTQRPLKLLYRSSIDCQNHNLDPKRLKKSLEVPICWLLIWSREPPRDWRFQWDCYAEDLHVSVVPICLIMFDLRTFFRLSLRRQRFLSLEISYWVPSFGRINMLNHTRHHYTNTWDHLSNDM